MSEILLYYKPVGATTWAYLSSLLIIALYFKFSRLWSVRNLDLIGLILLAPGLVFIIYGQNRHADIYSQAGYIWLFAVGGLFLVRMLLDPMMVRRPLLEPNLSVGGLTFLGLSLLMFFMANVLTEDTPRDKTLSQGNPTAVEPETPAVQPTVQPTTQPPNSGGEKPVEPESAATANDAATGTAAGTGTGTATDKPENAPVEEALQVYGPGFPWLFDIGQQATRLLFGADSKQPAPANEHEANNLQISLRRATARTVTICSYLAIVLGLVFIGFRHFDNVKTGIAAAVVYLLLPYTAFLTGRYLAIGVGQDVTTGVGQAYHVLLAALLVWAFAMYRRPLVSGILLGLAIGMFYYPIWLLPLWCSFYWQRGVVRFGAGVVAMLLLLVGVLYFHPHSHSFMTDLQQMFGALWPRSDHLVGFWGLKYNDSVYRIPVLVAFIAMCVTLAIWPAQKNLGTLLSCSTAVMLGAQFWHPLGGGQLIGWYLPLMLLTIFRPNLEDRVALSVLGEWSFAKRKPRVTPVEQAA
jgi:hypothetical protein